MPDELVASVLSDDEEKRADAAEGSGVASLDLQDSERVLSTSRIRGDTTRRSQFVSSKPRFVRGRALRRCQLFIFGAGE